MKSSLLAILTFFVLAVTAVAGQQAIYVDLETGTAHYGSTTPNFAGLKIANIIISPVAGVATWMGGPTSAHLAAAITDPTGSGSAVFANTPTLVTPILGAATATSINGITLTSSTGTITLTNGKTWTVTNTLTFSGTDGSTLNVGAGGTLAALAFKATAAEGDISLSDVTTDNASATKHGFAPKLPNDASKYYDGTGAFSVPSGLATHSAVASETAKLALTGMVVGQLVPVNYSGNGYALYRYEGGGESSSADWSLLSPLAVVRTTGDSTTFVDTTFRDDGVMQIDYVPPGLYEVQIRFTTYSPVSGIKWRLATSGTAVAYERSSYLWYGAPSNGNSVTDLFTGQSETSASGAEYPFWISGTINVSVAGNLRVQFAEATSDSTPVAVYSGSLRLIKIK